MKENNYKKLKMYIPEINTVIEKGYISDFTTEKLLLFKHIYKDETGSNEYNTLMCNRCKFNLIKDIYNLINKHEESLKPKKNKKNEQTKQTK